MQLNFQLNEPNSPDLQLQRSFWTGKTRLFVSGREVPMQPKNGMFDKNRSFVVPMSDGSQRQLVFTNRFYDPVPVAHVDGQPLTLAKDLKTWEYIVACVPFVLVFGGGLLGGGIGAAAAFTNLNIMRSERPQGLRIALCCGLTVVAFIAVVLLVGALQVAMNT